MKTIREVAAIEFSRISNLNKQSKAADFAESVLAAYLEQQTPVGHGLFVDGECVSIGQHRSSGYIGRKSYKSQPLYLAPPIKPGMVLVPEEPTEAMLDLWPFDGETTLSDPSDKEDLRGYYKAMLQAAKGGE